MCLEFLREGESERHRDPDGFIPSFARRYLEGDFPATRRLGLPRRHGVKDSIPNWSKRIAKMPHCPMGEKGLGLGLGVKAGWVREGGDTNVKGGGSTGAAQTSISVDK